MPTESGIREVTAPIEFAVAGDRLHCTLISGDCTRTFSVPFHEVRRAAFAATQMLDESSREHRVFHLGRGSEGH